MPGYIELVKAIESICNCCQAKGNCQGECAEVTDLKAIPMADVQEVKHGKWITTGMYDNHKQPIYMCANCNREVADYFIDRHAFCLFCGAKMDEKNEGDGWK